MFKNLVKEKLKRFNITDENAEEILKDIEKEVGHNHELIKAIVDIEDEKLMKRLKKKKKEVDVAYA
jgi:hypothetical protein